MLKIVHSLFTKGLERLERYQHAAHLVFHYRKRGWTFASVVITHHCSIKKESTAKAVA